MKHPLLQKVVAMNQNAISKRQQKKTMECPFLQSSLHCYISNLHTCNPTSLLVLTNNRFSISHRYSRQVGSKRLTCFAWTQNKWHPSFFFFLNLIKEQRNESTFLKTHLALLRVVRAPPFYASRAEQVNASRRRGLRAGHVTSPQQAGPPRLFPRTRSNVRGVSAWKRWALAMRGFDRSGIRSAESVNGAKTGP